MTPYHQSTGSLGRRRTWGKKKREERGGGQAALETDTSELYTSDTFLFSRGSRGGKKGKGRKPFEISVALGAKRGLPRPARSPPRERRKGRT